jgi:uncharacterized protein (DUF58 family)
VTNRHYFTDSFFLLLGGILLLGVASLVWPWLQPIFFLAWPLVAALTWIDRASLVDANRFKAELKIPRTPELGDNTHVEISVIPEGSTLTQLSSLSVTLPPSRTLRFDRSMARLLRHHKEGRVEYSTTVSAHAERLGFERVEAIRLWMVSRLGLWARVAQVPVEAAAFRVIPTRKKTSEQSFHQLVSQQRLLYQGSRQLLRGRSADQFHSIRKYQFPDPLRHLDHKKTAKYGQWMTRIFDTFYDHHIVLGLDLGRAMLGDIEGSSKFDFYLSACLLLAQNAVNARDRVSFFAFSQRTHSVIRNSRRISLFLPLFEGHPDLRPREEESNFELVPPTLSKLTGQRSIFLLFTDITKPSVQEALLKMLPALSQKHLTIVVSVLDRSYVLEQQVMTLADRSFDLSEYNRLLYAYWLNDRTELLRRQIAQYGGGVLMVSHHDWLSIVLKIYSLLRSSVSL